jgi:hypothetical protein
MKLLKIHKIIELSDQRRLALAQLGWVLLLLLILAEIGC